MVIKDFDERKVAAVDVRDLIRIIEELIKDPPIEFDDKSESFEDGYVTAFGLLTELLKKVLKDARIQAEQDGVNIVS